MGERKAFLTADWRDLLMLNYAIDPEVLRPYTPKGTELDAFDGRTYVSMVGFRFLHTRVKGIPIPFHRNFDEINLRFYVRRESPMGVRRGVVFIKEIVPRRAIAWVARTIYGENYVRHPMRSTIVHPTADRAGSAVYTWKDAGRSNALVGHFQGTPSQPDPDSEASFIAEHYWGYAKQRDGGTVEYEVEHPPWNVWRTTSAHFDCDIARHYGADFVDTLSAPPTSAFVADGSHVTVYAGKKI